MAKSDQHSPDLGPAIARLREIAAEGGDRVLAPNLDAQLLQLCAEIAQGRRITEESSLADLALWAADASDGIQAIIRLVKEPLGEGLDADHARVAISYVALKLERDIAEIQRRLTTA